MRTICLVLLGVLLPLSVSAITIEVVRVFQPLSLHGTDGAGDVEDEEEILQAAVMSRPMALAGAIPEDLVKAVADPCRIPANTPAYQVAESNLLLLCGISLGVDMLQERLLVTLDVSKLEIPEEVDLTARQVLNLTIRAVRKTLESYYAHGGEKLRWEVRVTGAGEGQASLKDLSGKHTIGE
jgi:hypothetical protein